MQPSELHNFCAEDPLPDASSIVPGTPIYHLQDVTVGITSLQRFDSRTFTIILGAPIDPSVDVAFGTGGECAGPLALESAQCWLSLNLFAHAVKRYRRIDPMEVLLLKIVKLQFVGLLRTIDL